MTNNDTAYTPITESDLPEALTWIVPSRNQGQIVEVAYSTGSSAGNMDADHGDAYQRVTDRSDGSVTYYRRRS